VRKKVFSSKKNEKKLDETSTIVGEETTFTGSLEVHSSIRIDGTIYGELNCSGDVTIGQEGYVEKTVTARNLFLAGKIQGDVKVANKIHIYDTGSLDGKAEMNTIVIDEKGQFNGESVMRETEVHTTENVVQMDEKGK
jgi:cytoskeletal protein CcmA (bactofilin family)